MWSIFLKTVVRGRKIFKTFKTPMVLTLEDEDIIITKEVIIVVVGITMVDEAEGEDKTGTILASHSFMVILVMW